MHLEHLPAKVGTVVQSANCAKRIGSLLVVARQLMVVPFPVFLQQHLPHIGIHVQALLCFSEVAADIGEQLMQYVLVLYLPAAAAESLVAADGLQAASVGLRIPAHGYMYLRPHLVVVYVVC